MRNADSIILEQASEVGMSAPTFEATRPHQVRGAAAIVSALTKASKAARDADFSILNAAGPAHPRRNGHPMTTPDAEHLRTHAEDVVDLDAFLALVNPYRQPCGRIAIGPTDT